MLGIAIVLWKDAVVAAVRSAIRDSATPTHKDRRVIFGSMRFPPPREALQLQEALRQHKVELTIIDMTAGGDIDTSVFEGIEEADSFLVFGTSHYGECSCLALTLRRFA